MITYSVSESRELILLKNSGSHTMPDKKVELKWNLFFRRKTWTIQTRKPQNKFLDKNDTCAHRRRKMPLHPDCEQNLCGKSPIFFFPKTNGPSAKSNVRLLRLKYLSIGRPLYMIFLPHPAQAQVPLWEAMACVDKSPANETKQNKPIINTEVVAMAFNCMS